MATLHYGITTSLDGYVADRNGDFGWGMPSEEVHAFVNDRERGTGTFLLGRKMYETLAVWDTLPYDEESQTVNEFANIWKAADKIVYSKSLAQPGTLKTTIEREFDPEVVSDLKRHSDKNLSIGGPHLAAAAIEAGLVDEIYQFIVPVIIGSGIFWLPPNLSLDLDLVDVRSFQNGFVYLCYKPRSSKPLS